MDNCIIVNANNVGSNVAVIVDMMTRRHKIVNITKDVLNLVPSFRSISCNYEGDTTNLDSSEGTIAYIDKNKKYYGILKFNKGKLNLYWIADIDLTPETKNTLLNSSCKNAVVLDEFSEDFLSKLWFPSGPVAIVKSLKRALRSKEQFINYISGKIDSFDKIETLNVSENTTVIEDDKDIKLENTVVGKDNTTFNFSNSTTNNISSTKTSFDFGDSKPSIVKMPNAIPTETPVPKKVAVESDKEELNRLSKMDSLLSRLESLLTKLEGNDYEEAVATIVNVNDIYSFDDYADDDIKQSDVVYETLLKMASQFDCISVSSEYFNKIKLYLKKTLTSSIDYSSYRAIALIRFESGSQFGILALVDYTEGNDMVRITILKRYSNKPITDEEVNKYYIHYEAIRKKCMFMYK